MGKVLRIEISLGDNATDENFSRIATVALTAVVNGYGGHGGLLLGHRVSVGDGNDFDEIQASPNPVIDRVLPSLSNSTEKGANVSKKEDKPCTQCKGSGEVPGMKEGVKLTCPVCKGSGKDPEV